MNIKDNYFLIFAHNPQDDEYSFIDTHHSDFLKKVSADEDVFLQICAIFFCLSSSNFDDFLKISKQNKTLISFFPFSLDITNIKAMQLLSFLALMSIANKSKNDCSKYLINIQNNIDALYEIDFALREHYIKAKGLIEHIISTTQNQNQSMDNIQEDKQSYEYINKISNIKNIALKSQDAIDNKDINKDISSIIDNLENQSFCLGVTGIMNSGKSTMLNALLKKQILGTAIIPETANLSILKYDKKEYAKVHFYNKREWESIKTSFDFREKKYAKSSDFIYDEGLIKQIPLPHLNLYTSANSSAQCSIFVKEIEIFTNLDYLKSGVCIVDTPGIDDPIAYREELTKNYLSKCDVMIHLMNSSQVNTNKDMDFILDAILYQNISHIIIAITHIDNIDNDKLKEVIDYSKNSFIKYAKNANKNIDEVFKKIKFIPLASNIALNYRLNKPNDNKGYKLEDTGILELEDEILNLLFGENSQKSKIIIKSTIKKLEQSINSYIDLLSNKKQLLQKSEDEIKNQIQKSQNEIKEFQELSINASNQMQNNLISLKDLFVSFGDVLENGINNFKARYINQISQSIEHCLKSKKQLNDDDINFMVSFSIKDGIFDIIRDFRFSIIKKVDNLIQDINNKGFVIEDIEIMSLFAKTAFFTQSYQNSIKKLSILIDNKSTKNLENNLLDIFNSLFDKLKIDIQGKMQILSDDILDTLEVALQENIESKKKVLEQRDVELKNILENKSYKKDSEKEQENIEKKSFSLRDMINNLETYSE